MHRINVYTNKTLWRKGWSLLVVESWVVVLMYYGEIESNQICVELEEIDGLNVDVM